jgi:hypothetical protein
VGAAAPAVLFPRKAWAAKFDSVNVSAGVVVEVATEVVKMGDSVPAEKSVTVPEPPAATPRISVPKMLSR